MVAIERVRPTTPKINFLSSTFQRKLGLVEAGETVNSVLSKPIGEMLLAWTRMTGSSTEEGGRQIEGRLCNES